MTRTRHPRPVYIVERSSVPHSSSFGSTPRLMWRVMHFQRPDDAKGCVIGTWPSRKAALLTARLLAGHSADVLIWNSRKAAPYKGL